MEMDHDKWFELIGHLNKTSTNAEASHKQLLEINDKLAKMLTLMETMVNKLENIDMATTRI